MSDQSQTPKIILIAEDEGIVALCLGDDLTEAGYEIVGPFATCAEAMRFLEDGTPDLAVLDPLLKDGSCQELASELARRGVPFVIYSGNRRDTEALAEFGNATWVEKPAASEAIIEALSALAGRVLESTDERVVTS